MAQTETGGEHAWASCSGPGDGSRTWRDVAAIVQALAVILDRHPEGVLLVHGACPRGARNRLKPLRPALPAPTPHRRLAAVDHDAQAVAPFHLMSPIWADRRPIHQRREARLDPAWRRGERGDRGLLPRVDPMASAS